MAEVQLAIQRGPAGFEKLVVVKLVHESLASQRSFVDMLLDEARVAALVKHPNVVDIYDLGEVDGRYFIAMEYLEGEPLLAVLRAGRDGQRLDALSTARLIADTAEGLDAAHELRSMAGEPIELVHHDISPGNIVVLYNGVVKLVDFGVAKVTQSAATRNKIQGKFAYMAPEKLRGGRGDRRSDLWSLGCVLWEALTLRRLFKGGNDRDTVLQVLDSAILAPSRVNRVVPVELDAVVLRALERDPARRYPSAKALAADLEAVLRLRGYVAKNDQIAKYMQVTFHAHIAARKRLLQEVSSKGRASQDLVAAAFNVDTIASGSPACLPEVLAQRAVDPDLAGGLPAGDDSTARAQPANAAPWIVPPLAMSPPPTATDEQTIVDSPAISQARPWLPARAAPAASTLAPTRPRSPMLPRPAMPRPPLARAALPVPDLPEPAVSPVSPAIAPPLPRSALDPVLRPLPAAPDVPAPARRRIWIAYPGIALAVLTTIAVWSLRTGSTEDPPLVAARLVPPPVQAPVDVALPLAALAPPALAPPAPTARAPQAPPAGRPRGSTEAPHVAALDPAPRPARRVPAKPTSAPRPPIEKINPEAVYRAGLQAWVHGDARGALTAYRRVLQANPAFAPAWRNIGLVEERLGDPAAARAAFHRYLQLAPTASDASEIRARIEAQ
jgi:eukaryotic-like serine/threonine-protein kinase